MVAGAGPHAQQEASSHPIRSRHVSCTLSLREPQPGKQRLADLAAFHPAQHGDRAESQRHIGAVADERAMELPIELVRYGDVHKQFVRFRFPIAARTATLHGRSQLRLLIAIAA